MLVNVSAVVVAALVLLRVKLVVFLKLPGAEPVPSTLVLDRFAVDVLSVNVIASSENALSLLTDKRNTKSV